MGVTEGPGTLEEGATFLVGPAPLKVKVGQLLEGEGLADAELGRVEHVLGVGVVNGPSVQEGVVVLELEVV